MVDNVVLNAGAGGVTLAADEIAGVHHQRVKLQVGADGAAADISDANPLPIDDAGGSLTVDGTITANAGTGTFTVDGSGVTQPISAAALPLPSGAATAAAQLPDGHNVTVDNAAGAAAVNIQDGGNSITVDGAVAATNAGTFAVQEDGAALTALQLIDDIVATDDTTTHATGTTKGAGIMAAATPTDGSVGANDIGMLAMSTDRRLHTDTQIVGQDATLTVDGSGVTQPISAASLPLPTGAATAANQLPDGHNVTVDNAAGASAVNIQDGGNSITVDGTITANAGTNLNTSALALETGGNLATVAGAVSGTEMQVDVVAALPAGSNLIGNVGIGVRTSGGTTLYKNIDVDESEDQVKGTAGQVYWIHAINLRTSPLYLKFYNATAASVTVGTTVPDLTFPVPSQGTANGGGFTLSIPNGIAFGTAITIAGTTGVADNDSGAPAANELIVNLGYA